MLKLFGTMIKNGDLTGSVISIGTMIKKDPFVDRLSYGKMIKGQ
ncbi:hypothetical protein C942_04228 [Photobacterium marinum]|uniref:Uncharacterized protein n=1 Tax=Photobacterium marinum TaxID=1056511 RepID=L8JCF7_9GAMM|nr:hypothetical protein C942_04228 [Photobacterium marinum]